MCKRCFKGVHSSNRIWCDVDDAIYALEDKKSRKMDANLVMIQEEQSDEN